MNNLNEISITIKVTDFALILQRLEVAKMYLENAQNENKKLREEIANLNDKLAKGNE